MVKVTQVNGPRDSLESWVGMEGTYPSHRLLRLRINDVQVGLPDLLSFPGRSHLETCPIKESAARFIKKPEIIGIHE